ncbi:MAG TPA: TetR/AcrR family transcriptional regulator [Caulobacteraceae bacterium]
MSVRERQKQATRAKVIDAARDLFDETGYEETTIRAIAQKAGVSVGSVFTTFTSKADVLGQIMAERIDQLRVELERVAPLLRGSACDRLSSILAIHYDFQMRRPKLYLAYLSVSFGERPEQGFVRMGTNPGLRAPMLDIIRSGVDGGEIAPDVDIELLLDTVISLYGFNYMRANDGADAKALTTLMDRQLKLVFAGLAPRGGVNPAL